MPMLDNPKEEAFCQYALTEKSIADAYRKAFPHTKSWKDKSVHERSSKLFNSAKIVSRLAELKAELASKCLWTREQSVEVLKEIATRQEDKDQGIAPARDADRISSIKELNAMHGFNAPIEQNVNFKGQHFVTKTYVKMDELNAD
jgi:hypothetical protein